MDRDLSFSMSAQGGFYPSTTPSTTIDPRSSKPLLHTEWALAFLQKFFWARFWVDATESSKEMGKEGQNVPQRARSSSEPSAQSCWALHKAWGLVQLPSWHWNWPRRQKRCGHVSGSSEPSAQSFCPSHFHHMGMHLHKGRKPVETHRGPLT